MKKIKVAFFAETLIEDLDGATRTMFQLIKRIPKVNFEFLFVCGEGQENLYGFECMRIPSMTLPINRTYKMALPGLAITSLREKLRLFAPDVIHIATPSLLGEFAVRYARQSGLPAISIYHTHFISYIDYYLKHTRFLVDFVKNKMTSSHKAFYNQCDTIYVPSDTMAAELSGMGVEPYRMKIWKRGIDTGLFSPDKRDIFALRKLTGNSYPTILFASRLVWEKNLETLISVYEQLESEQFKFNLVIAGDGTARKICEERMPNALFAGKLSHQKLSVLYASADVFLFPSISEAYGNVVLEAMASGLPCVIADGGGSKDFIEQGINGYKCKPYDVPGFISKLQLILSNALLRNQIIEKGLQYSKLFEWDKLAATYFDDLYRLAGRQVYELA